MYIPNMNQVDETNAHTVYVFLLEAQESKQLSGGKAFPCFCFGVCLLLLKLDLFRFHLTWFLFQQEVGKSSENILPHLIK